VRPRSSRPGPFIGGAENRSEHRRIARRLGACGCAGHPVGSAQHVRTAAADRLGHVLRPQGVVAGKVGDRARDLGDAMEGARRQPEARHGFGEQRECRRLGRAVPGHAGSVESRVQRALTRGCTVARRRDASTALYEFAHRINAAFPEVAAELSVWTMGRVRVEPNAASIVPGYAELDLQFRDVSDAPLDAFEAVVARLVSEMNERGGVTIEAIPTRAPIPPTLMDPALRAHIEAAAEHHAPGHWQRMPSGAFHDAGIVSASLPSAMVFIPSIGGVSHDFAEDSREEDIVLGCQVLAEAAASILIEANPRS